MLKLPDRNAWNAGMPFPLAVTQWPWNPRLLAETVAAWPADDDPHWVPHRSGKRSYGVRDGTVPQQLRPILDKLHSPEFLRALEEMTGIGGLVCDPTLEGGGLHETAPGGRLGMHVDFNRLGTLHRRLNVLVYLNPIVPDNSGDLRLESDDGKDVRRVPPRMGTMVVFGTTDRSWHGQPSPLTWDFSRRSFAVYYYTAAPPPQAAKSHSTIYRGEEKHGGGATEVGTKPVPLSPEQWIPKPPDGPKEPLGVVTTFTAGMFEKTGRRLLRTWMDAEQWRHGPMLVCTEGKCDLPEHPRLLSVSLDDDPFLRAWLARNADVIPDYFGGRATSCDCPRKPKIDRGPRKVRASGRHRPNCSWSDYNRFSSRWFRKVAAVRLAVERLPTDRILWMDSDAAFRTAIPPDVFDACLGGQSLFYLMGTRRAAVESGIYGFVPEQSRLVTELIRRYCGSFRSMSRWDDGYVMGRLIRDGFVSGNDLVPPGPRGHVLPHTRLRKFVLHDKGIHHRMRGSEQEAVL